MNIKIYRRLKFSKYMVKNNILKIINKEEII